ncbi:MAG: hypothetical protein WCD79_07395 [Chthoniobacteraceae bacterium]
MQDVLNQILSWVSLLVGAASLVVAAYTIWLARVTERETRAAFQHAEDRMRDHYDRMKDVLAAIELRSSGIEQTVRLSQDHLLSTITNLVNETIIPKRPEMGEQLGMQFMQAMMQNPSQSGDMMKFLKDLAEMGKATKKRDA